MNSRAEKPNVPTPDAASVYAHHLSQMSRPMRTAVERYVDAVIHEAYVREQQVVASLDEHRKLMLEMSIWIEHAKDNLDPSVRADAKFEDFWIEAGNDDPFRCPSCHDDAGRSVNAHDEYTDCGIPDPLDARLDARLDAIARDRIASAPSPAAGAVALADVVWPEVPAGWWWKETHADCGGFHLRNSDADGGLVGSAWNDGKWRASAQNQPFLQATPPTLAAAQSALLAELRKRGTLPAAAASADVHGLGDGWRLEQHSGFDAREIWAHTSGAHIQAERGRWACYLSNGSAAASHAVATAAEAARLALAASTAPAAVRGDGAIDWEAVENDLQQAPAGVDRAIMRALRNYDAQCRTTAHPADQSLKDWAMSIEARLAQLEAAAGKKAGA
jgi:hypothetical protein